MVPAANFTDPAWGQIDAPTFSIEVNLGHDEVDRSFALHVRGGDEAVACVAAILDTVGARAIDTSSGSSSSDRRPWSALGAGPGSATRSSTQAADLAAASSVSAAFTSRVCLNNYPSSLQTQVGVIA